MRTSFISTARVFAGTRAALSVGDMERAARALAAHHRRGHERAVMAFCRLYGFRAGELFAREQGVLMARGS